MLHLLDRERGRRIHVLMPYADALRDTGDWFVQLWAESLGKRPDVGPTPFRAVGATDQHSSLQLMMEGPNDKVVTFVQVAQPRADVSMTVPDVYRKHAEIAYLDGHTMGELIEAERRATVAALRKAGRPTASIALPRLDARAMGELLMLLELATAYAGGLYGVNAFDQPGVEAGKRYAQGLLGRPGYEKARDELPGRRGRIRRSCSADAYRNTDAARRDALVQHRLERRADALRERVHRAGSSAASGPSAVERDGRAEAERPARRERAGRRRGRSGASAPERSGHPEPLGEPAGPGERRVASSLPTMAHGTSGRPRAERDLHEPAAAEPLQAVAVAPGLARAGAPLGEHAEGAARRARIPSAASGLARTAPTPDRGRAEDGEGGSRSSRSGRSARCAGWSRRSAWRSMSASHGRNPPWFATTSDGPVAGTCAMPRDSARHQAA